MNLRELNNPPTWVFVVTTIVIFYVAFLFWIATYQFNLAIHSPRALMPEQKSFVERLECLIWLLRRRHIIFLFRSGIVVSLLTDGKIGFKPACNDQRCARLTLESITELESRFSVRTAHNPNRPCTYIRYHREAGREWLHFRGIALDYKDAIR